MTALEEGSLDQGHLLQKQAQAASNSNLLLALFSHPSTSSSNNLLALSFPSLCSLHVDLHFLIVTESTHQGLKVYLSLPFFVSVNIQTTCVDFSRWLWASSVPTALKAQSVSH